MEVRITKEDLERAGIEDHDIFEGMTLGEVLRYNEEHYTLSVNEIHNFYFSLRKITQEDIVTYQKHFEIENSEIVYTSSSVKNSLCVINSSFIYNSDYVVNSIDIHDSQNIINCSGISNSTNCTNADNVENGTGIYFSEGIEDSYLTFLSSKVLGSTLTFDTKNIFLSNVVFNISNSNNIHLSKNITKSKNKILCSDVLNNDKPMILNLEISENIFKRTEEKLLNFILRYFNSNEKDLTLLLSAIKDKSGKDVQEIMALSIVNDTKFWKGISNIIPKYNPNRIFTIFPFASVYI